MDALQELLETPLFPTQPDYITVHADVEQGSDEWFAMRCGLLTASEMKLIITPAKLQYASNDKERAHLYELAAQRINKYVEPHYVSDDMLRGKTDEIEASQLYNKHYAPLETAGFVTNSKWGFTLGYSPDGLTVDGLGQIECKSRKQKFQLETINADEMPDDFKIQVQTGLLVTERSYCDFISYCGGMPMFVKRVYPDEAVQEAIVKAATTFHEKLEDQIATYKKRINKPGAKFLPTERKVYEEILA
jgi:hypothetical protein